MDDNILLFIMGLAVAAIGIYMFVLHETLARLASKYRDWVGLPVKSEGYYEGMNASYYFCGFLGAVIGILIAIFHWPF